VLEKTTLPGDFSLSRIFRVAVPSRSDNLPQARKKCSVMLHDSPRLVKYNSMEFSALGAPQDLAKGLHSSCLEGAICQHAAGFALIPAMVLPWWTTESKMAVWRVVFWGWRPKAVPQPKSSGNGSRLSNLAPT
jgi:hypothetical protein